MNQEKNLPEPGELSDDTLIDLTCEHLGLTRRRGCTLIDQSTGRYTDQQRYTELLRAGISADRARRVKVEPVAWQGMHLQSPEFGWQLLLSSDAVEDWKQRSAKHPADFAMRPLYAAPGAVQAEPVHQVRVRGNRHWEDTPKDKDAYFANLESRVAACLEFRTLYPVPQTEKAPSAQEVKIPANVAEAKAMALVSINWLEQHAPDELRMNQIQKEKHAEQPKTS